ncbi:unnamed protein product [Boreogadus saida]
MPSCLLQDSRKCLGAEHAVAALVAPASCAACRALPEEGLLSRHLFFSPSVDLAEAIDIFGAELPDAQDADERFEVDDVASLDDVFPGSASEFSRSAGASTGATIVPRERLRRMADLFGDIMGEAAAIKGIPMPAPPLAPMWDDMQGECFRTLSSSRRVTQCPLFPPVQHLFTAAGGDSSTLKAPVRAFTDFTNVEGWADTQARLKMAPKRENKKNNFIQGYLHGVTPVRSSAMNRKWFNFYLQTSRDEYRGCVVYATKKHERFVKAADNHTPLKLSKVKIPKLRFCGPVDEQLRRGELGGSPAAQLREYNPFHCRTGAEVPLPDCRRSFGGSPARREKASKPSSCLGPRASSGPQDNDCF